MHKNTINTPLCDSRTWVIKNLKVIKSRKSMQKFEIDTGTYLWLFEIGVLSYFTMPNSAYENLHMAAACMTLCTIKR